MKNEKNFFLKKLKTVISKITKLTEIFTQQHHELGQKCGRLGVISTTFFLPFVKPVDSGIGMFILFLLFLLSLHVYKVML
jgi:hypothetical protein